MSLSVPSNVHASARAGNPVPPQIFLDIVRQSLPAAWLLCEELSVKFRSAPREESADPFFAVTVITASEPTEYAQVLRAFASTSIRRELGRFFECEFCLLNEYTAAVMALGDAERVASIYRRDAALSKDVEPVMKRIQRKYPAGLEIFRQVASSVAETRRFACHAPRSMDEGVRHELLMLHAVLPDRLALQDKFKVEFAFQNCHVTGGKKGKVSSETFDDFCSIEAQILNQSAELVDC